VTEQEQKRSGGLELDAANRSRRSGRATGGTYVVPISLQTSLDMD
jgi:hypothetical protein